MMAAQDDGFTPDPIPQPTGDGFTPDDGFQASAPPQGFLSRAGALGSQGLSAAAKALDVARGTTTGPLLGAALELATGKPVYTAEDWKNAMNPTNLKKFPTSAEMMDRAGIPAGAELSDYAPIYADPGTRHPWYQPEKGGALDPTVRGAGGMGVDAAIDPLTYLTWGGAAATKKAAAESATRMAMGTAPEAGAATQALAKLADLPGAAAADAAGSLVTGPANWLGNRMQSSTLIPIEHEGAKYGKEAVGDTLYKSGIMNQFDLRNKVAGATDQIMDARNALLERAGQQGGQSSMIAATQPVQDELTRLIAQRDPGKAGIIQALQDKIESYRALERPTPAVPDTVLPPTSRTADTGFVDAAGNPITRSEQVPGGVVPGSPEIPGIPVTPAQSSAYKTTLYDNLPVGHYSDAVKTKLGANLNSQLASGLKTETEDAVGRALGPDSADALRELNTDAGNLLSTRKGQIRAENLADRQQAALTSAKWGDMMAEGALHNILGIPGSGFALKKGLDAARLGSMTGGYALRKLGDSSVVGPALDLLAKEKLEQKFGQTNPWTPGGPK